MGKKEREKIRYLKKKKRMKERVSEVYLFPALNQCCKKFLHIKKTTKVCIEHVG